MKSKINNLMDTVSSNDSKLFRESIGTVTPVSHNLAGARQQKSRPRPVPSHTLKDAAEVLRQLQEQPFAVEAVETGDELSFLRPGVQKQLLRKLKRGHIAIQAELDLHGMFVDQARPAVTAFIANCTARDQYAIRIIHGKGLGSRDKYPVLKNKVNQWLQTNSEVLAFCSARPVDGGTGAVYVLLKRSDR
jgi:DNA-nicking Smr family endonuclease